MRLVKLGIARAVEVSVTQALSTFRNGFLEDARGAGNGRQVPCTADRCMTLRPPRWHGSPTVRLCGRRFRTKGARRASWMGVGGHVQLRTSLPEADGVCRGYSRVETVLVFQLCMLFKLGRIGIYTRNVSSQVNPGHIAHSPPLVPHARLGHLPRALPPDGSSQKRTRRSEEGGHHRVIPRAGSRPFGTTANPASCCLKTRGPQRAWRWAG